MVYNTCMFEEFLLWDVCCFEFGALQFHLLLSRWAATIPLVPDRLMTFMIFFPDRHLFREVWKERERFGEVKSLLVRILLLCNGEGICQCRISLYISAPPYISPAPVQRCVRGTESAGAPGRSCGTAPRRWHRAGAWPCEGSGNPVCPRWAESTVSADWTSELWHTIQRVRTHRERDRERTRERVRGWGHVSHL